jgi:hypothetical protein
MISFFAKNAFLARDRHLLRGSSVIRGQQMAEYLGAKYNPTEGYEDDICIYIKPELGTVFKGTPYVDIVDDYAFVRWLKKHPDLPVIACSKANYDYLMKVLKNRVVLIPQHHCNYDRFVRDRKTITTVGTIGTPRTVDEAPEELQQGLKDLGLKLKTDSKFRTREDVVAFYKTIDIQIIWRWPKIRMKNPLKIINAASFGIPTVAYDEEAFKEVEECYVQATDIKGILNGVSLLQDTPEVYQWFSQRCIGKAEEYHISKIADLYKKLCTI